MATSRYMSVGSLIMMLSLAQGAATPAAAQTGLADITRATCTFSLVATGTWTEGEPEVELDPSTLSVRFVEIDADAATANIEGRYGESHLITRLSGDYLHFMAAVQRRPALRHHDHRPRDERRKAHGRPLAARVHRRAADGSYVEAGAVLRRVRSGLVDFDQYPLTWPYGHGYIG